MGLSNDISERDLTVNEAMGIWSAPTDESRTEAIRNGYSLSVRTKVVFILVCLVVLLISIVCAVGFGPYDIGFSESVRIIADNLFGTPDGSINDYFVWEGRLPRALMGVVTGAGLAVGGCVMQSILSNDLADCTPRGSPQAPGSVPPWRSSPV